MDDSIPPLLQPLLQEYTDRLKQELPGKVNAFYLEGSLALGEFNPRLSDIDFLGILESEATPADFADLMPIHKRIEQKYPWQMSGIYLPARDLGCDKNTVHSFLHYHDGKLKWENHFELSAVTWWILKNHGVTVFGPSIESLNITVDMDELLRVQQRNLNTYWASWTTRPGRLLALTTDWGIQWAVLGISRLFYTIHEQKITSKIKAGEYALGRLPERWHPLIRQAIALRENPERSYYHSRIKRAFDAFYFIQYVIQSCNEYLPA